MKMRMYQELYLKPSFALKISGKKTKDTSTKHQAKILPIKKYCPASLYLQGLQGSDKGCSLKNVL